MTDFRELIADAIYDESLGLEKTEIKPMICLVSEQVSF